MAAHPFVSFQLWFMRLVVLIEVFYEDLILHVI